MTIRLKLDEIKKLCEAGGMAPSGGNAQPWRVVAGHNSLEIRLDPKRSDSFLGVGKLASVFALGCSAENVCIAANFMGLKHKLEFIDHKNIDNCFARVLFTQRRKVVSNADSLYPFIKKRVTNRQLYDGTIIDKKDFAIFTKLVNEFDSGYKLTAVWRYEDKVKAADILGKADGTRMSNDRLFNEMVNEFRWSEKEVRESRDGLDLNTLELPGNAAKMLFLLRKFPLARKIIPRKALERFARPLMLGCSHLCCLSVYGKPTPKAIFFAGQIVERLWLTATKLNLAIQPWTALNFMLIRAKYFPKSGLTPKEEKETIQLGKNFSKLYALSENEFPIFIFRLSKAKSPSARSLRIPWRKYTEVSL